MIGFLIKKAFFDGWDNFLGLLGINVCYLGLFALGVNAVKLIGTNQTLGLILFVVFSFLFTLITLAGSKITYGYSTYKKLGWSGIKEAFSTHIPHCILYFVYVLFTVFCAGIVIPFYFAYNNFVGLLVGMVLVWTLVIFALAMQYFFPLAFSMQKDKPLKTMKKCFMVFADNFWISMFAAIYSLINGAISYFTAGIIPGGGGISLLHMDTVKLLMLKYDWKEANPGEDMNWDDALYDERELIGHRSFKNMIFPWKD